MTRLPVRGTTMVFQMARMGSCITPKLRRQMMNTSYYDHM
jgi:hypothetical protein